MPKASIVILSRNPPDKLLKLIDSQTYQSHETIIAREKGIVNAMNWALDRANGDILVRIDDDVDFGRDWLEELIKSFMYPKVGGVTGPTYIPKELRKNRDSINFIDKYGDHWFVKWLFDNQVYFPAKIYKCGSVGYGSNFTRSLKYIDIQPHAVSIDHLEGTNWAMRTDLIRKVGGFDPKFDGVCEWYDTDVEQKIKKLGYSLVYNPLAIVWHLVGKGQYYKDRYSGLGRIKNWLRFHWRHSKFHYRKIVWLLVMLGYTFKNWGHDD